MALREICFFLEKIQHALNFYPTLPHKKNICRHFLLCFLVRWKEGVNKWSHMFFP